MNRLRVKAGNACCLVTALALFALVVPPAARAAGNTDFWFAGTRLIFENLQQRNGEAAVASGDSGLARFLGAAGAGIAYQPGQNYLIVTTADRRTINFSLGDAQFTVNGVTQVAPFAPYVSGRDVFLPFLALAKALYIDGVVDGGTTVLQPQLGSLDVRTQGRTTVVTLRAGTALHYKRLSGANEEHIALEFEGVGSTLERERRMPASGTLRGVAITASGMPRNPVTIVDIDAVPGSVHALLPADSRNAISLAFAPAGVALGGSAIPADGSVPPATALAPPPPVATPSSEVANGQANVPATPAPLASGAAPAQVTGFKTSALDDDGVNVDVAVSGNASYEWHRLGDNRWYVDLKPATLTIPSQDVPLRYQAMPSMRLKSFVGPHDALPTVRVAFSLDSPRTVSLASSASGLTLQIGAVDDSTLQRVGYGRLGAGTSGIVAAAGAATAPASGSVAGSAPAGVAFVAPSPEPPAAPAPASTWKFGPQASYNSRLIVIDPGHGGSDAGAQHNGLTEKSLNLDVSLRLRDLLVSRGWVVKMTRQTDVDVYQPNDSARDELQARCDVANAAGARFFISVHTNSFTSSWQHGTTTYFYQAQSYGLAQAVHERLAATLPTADDGIIKENFYVVHHTKMPSILVEMAFLSNPTDAAYLRTDGFLQKMALGIADGVGNYASSPSQPVSSTDSDPPPAQ
jgi:N-acetylmuramoyl-L-alanine amidase